MENQERGIKFCEECYNLLYPVEVPVETEIGGQLVFMCKHCSITIEADESNPQEHIVFRNDLHERAAAALVDREASLDPTLARDLDTECPKCGFTEAVYFQDTSTGGQEGMDMIYVCARQRPDWCGYWWHPRDMVVKEAKRER